MRFSSYFTRAFQKSSAMSVTICLMLLPLGIVQLFNPAASLAQSTTVRASTAQSYSLQRSAIPNSISRAQLVTESLLAQPVSSFAIHDDETLPLRDVVEAIGVTVFIDINLDGVLSVKDDLNMRSGVSMAKAFSFALKECDAEYLIDDDGSILLICVDDANEPRYMSVVTYDVTRLTGSASKARQLAHVLCNSIHSDSWEANGGGNGTLSAYSNNGKILFTISQSQTTHRSIRRHFNSIVGLGARRSAAMVANPAPATTRTMPVRPSPLSSSVVQVPRQQTTKSLRMRRGLARPNSGSTGGFGGGGAKGGVF